MANKVSVLDKDGAVTEYSTYAAARAAIISEPILHPLIQIWATLNEQIVLLDGVDIWIAPGVTLNNTSGVTITDIDNNLSQQIHCTIYGKGKIKNTGGYSCIFIDNPNSYLSVTCDQIFGSGSISVYIRRANKFNLISNYVYNQYSQAIQIGQFLVAGFIDEINLNVVKVETGDLNISSSGITALSTRANGIININKIICNNLGHCLTHHEGSITARIKELTTKNRRSGNSGATVHVSQFQSGQVGTQKLILYFDEINALGTESIGSNEGIQVTEGTGIFIGRRVYAKNSPAIETVTNGSITCNEIISELANAIGLNPFSGQIIINASYIEGYSTGEAGVIFSNGNENYTILNARIKNTNTVDPSRGISLFLATVFPNVTLKNVKIITAITTNSQIIYVNTPSTIVDVKNYGLISNKNIDTSMVNLTIGTDLSDPGLYNYQFIYDPLLT